MLNLGALEEVCKRSMKLGTFITKHGGIQSSRAKAAEKERVLKALAIALFTRTAIKHTGVDEYWTVHNNVSAKLAPPSALLNGAYEWIVYTNLSMTGGRVYLKTASIIDPEWLVDLPYFSDDRLPMKHDKSTYRQENVKKSLDYARAAIKAASESHALASSSRLFLCFGFAPVDLGPEIVRVPFWGVSSTLTRSDLQVRRFLKSVYAYAAFLMVILRDDIGDNLCAVADCQRSS
ncbi:hypothetical protein QQS21_012365 [Conoideocrella luteorostrata]|uniref:DEAD-box helicase OB fold domain-containing protein n=1 Tax=Conoideocrella luteorostrata TaxID=1105319 RepID=A0AAJ0CDN6_9HYPO|nr:hypothetical protein QQS21_012365 [Conoideocrella luteorostrata]